MAPLHGNSVSVTTWLDSFSFRYFSLVGSADSNFSLVDWSDSGCWLAGLAGEGASPDSVSVWLVLGESGTVCFTAPSPAPSCKQSTSRTSSRMQIYLNQNGQICGFIFYKSSSWLAMIVAMALIIPTAGGGRWGSVTGTSSDTGPCRQWQTRLSWQCQSPSKVSSATNYLWQRHKELVKVALNFYQSWPKTSAQQLSLSRTDHSLCQSNNRILTRILTKI